MEDKIDYSFLSNNINFSIRNYNYADFKYEKIKEE